MTEQGLSQADEEIMKEKQKAERKEYKKELKHEIEAKLRELIEKKEIDFEIKHVEDLYILKYKCLEAEESLQKKLQAEMHQLQRSNLDKEHQLLFTNLKTLQDLMEKFFEEELELRKKLAPIEAAARKAEIDGKIQKIIRDEEKIIDDAKARAQSEYDDLVKKYEEEMAQLQKSLDDIPKEDRKKAFLTKRFNLQAQAPNRTRLDLQLTELNSRFESFKLQKQKISEEQQKLIFSVDPHQDEEIEAHRKQLQQTHKSREEKLLQFQKEEKAKLEKLLEEAEQQLAELILQRRQDMEAEHEKDKATAMQPPAHQDEEQQEDEDDD